MLTHRLALPMALAACAIAVRVPFFSVPMISDEGSYLYVATFWTDSYRLYREIPFDRPQAIFLIYDAIIWLLGSHVEAVRLAAALWNALTAAAIFWFAFDANRSRNAAAGAAVLFAVCSTSPGIEGFTANAELFAVLPLVLSAHLTWKRQWYWAGLLAGLATVIKPIGVSGVMLTAAWILATRGGVRALLATGAGFALVPALSLMHIAVSDWQGFWQSQQQKLLANTFAGNPVSLQFNLFLSSTLKTLPAWLGLAALGGIGLQRADSDVRRFGILWIVSSLLGMLIGGNWYWHYWTQLIPVLAWLSAAALVQNRPLRLAWPTLVFCGLSGALFLQYEVPLWFEAPSTVSWQVYQRPDYLVENDIADYIAGATSPDDTIFVAFSSAAIYPLSGRKASPPHLNRYEFINTRQAYANVVQSIQRREPAFVVWVNDPPGGWASPEDFRTVLESSNYRVQRVFGQIAVYAAAAQSRALALDSLNR